VTVAARYSFEQVSETFNISGHVLADDEPLLFRHQRRPGSLESGKALVDLAEPPALLPCAKNAVEKIQVIVARRSFDRPCRRQLFIDAKNLFYGQV